MPRKGHIAKRTVQADPVYGSDLVTKFINSMTYGGKRSVSQGIMYDALNVVQAKTQEDPLKVFKRIFQFDAMTLQKGINFHAGFVAQQPPKLASRNLAFAVGCQSQRLLERARELRAQAQPG